MLWLALILPELPLQVLVRGLTDPGLLAITENQPRPLVIAATAAARKRGIQIGQGVSSALAVVPELNLRPRTPAAERTLLHEVATWAGAFASRISLDPPDCVLLEVASSLRLFGGLATLQQSLHAGLLQQGLLVHSACAPTPLAARWFARNPAKCPQATEDARATGWRAHLDALPLDVLVDGSAVSPASLELLAGIGLRTLGEIRALPVAGLARRQAQAVTDTLSRAYGDTSDLRPEYTPPVSYLVQLALLHPTSHTEPLLFAARRLFAGLASWLAARHAGIDHCRLSLIHERGPDTVLDILTGTPSRDEARLNLLARERIAALRLSSPVEELRLETHGPRPLAARSNDLFGDPASARENAGLLLDRLRARLGTGQVRQLSAFPDQRPEHAWRSMPFGECPAGALPAAGAAPATPRPLWLLASPRRLAEPTDLHLLRGPERIEHGWWDGHDIRRDYYLAKARDDALWWIYRELDPPGDWYVHGYFA